VRTLFWKSCVAPRPGWADKSVVQLRSCVCDIIYDLRCQLLDEVHQISQEAGRKFPSHLVLQSDNTPAQAKNSDVLLFLAYLVARGKWMTQLDCT
jgi:hypothetical protein